jgi:hypothetical protein
VALPTVKEQILSDLDRLSPEQQKRAAELVHRLVAPLPNGASVKDLLSIAGTLNNQAAGEMMQAIEEGCERVDCTLSDQALRDIMQPTEESCERVDLDEW